MSLPRVTYIICHQNYQDTLPAAIKSAKSQTYPTHICVIDDGSDDQDSVDDIITDELFANQAEQMSQEDGIIYRENANYTAIFLPKASGPSHARNIGIQRLWERTDFFAILDADDENYPQKVEVLVRIMLQSPEIGVAYADYDILNVDTGEVYREYKEPYDQFRLQQECIVHSGALISKAALAHVHDENGFYDVNMRTCEDFDLWIRISKDFMIYHVPHSLSLVRVHSRNSTFSVQNEIWQQNWQRIQQKHNGSFQTCYSSQAKETQRNTCHIHYLGREPCI